MSMQNVINTWVVIFLAIFIYQNIQLKSDIAKLSEANNNSKLIKLQEEIDRLDLMISSADAKSNQNEDNIKNSFNQIQTK